MRISLLNRRGLKNLDEEKSGEPIFDEQTPEKTQGE